MSVLSPKKVLKSQLKYEPVYCIERALDAVMDCNDIEAKIKKAEKEGRFLNNPYGNVRDIYNEAFKQKIISKTEFDKIQLKNDTVARVINVDEFDKNLKKLKAAPKRTIK